MKFATIPLLCALVFALCLPSFALTEQQAIQAVRDFEKNQSLKVTGGSSGAMRPHSQLGLGTSTHSVYAVKADVCINGCTEAYMIAEYRVGSGPVCRLHNGRRRASCNRSPQAEVIADSYATAHTPGFSQEPVDSTRRRVLRGPQSTLLSGPCQRCEADLDGCTVDVPVHRCVTAYTRPRGRTSRRAVTATLVISSRRGCSLSLMSSYL